MISMNETDHDVLIRIDERTLTIQRWMVQHSADAKERDERIQALETANLWRAGWMAGAGALGGILVAVVTALVKCL